MKNLIIEVRGGVVAEVYSDEKDLNVILIDWDNVDEGDEPGQIPLQQLSHLHHETRKLLDPGYNLIKC